MCSTVGHKDKKYSLETGVKSTFKSADTEEWLDKVWTRPIGYLFAFFSGRYISPPKEYIPDDIKSEFRRRSLSLMTIANILTFNTRAIFLYVLCILDLPWAYFLFEIVIMSALKKYMNWKHERLCADIINEIKRYN